jgi:aromatic ring-opening dioxygenase catalytic subunit (LigB family)
LFLRRELEEQAEEYEEMYEKRFKLLQQSVKKATTRKRRRQDDGAYVPLKLMSSNMPFKFLSFCRGC